MPTMTRYQKVKKILNDAAVDSTAEYQGTGPFWDLCHREFLEVVVYGVRMIAPREHLHTEPKRPQQPPVKSCCGEEESSAEAESEEDPTSKAKAEPTYPNYDPTRGKRSGLIKGLQAECPFDGNPFPALPWGGKRVIPENIQFIQEWIDDGCPESDWHLPLEQPAAEQTTEQEEPETQQVYVVPVDEYIYEKPWSKRVRMNVDCMSEGQLETLREGFREMYALNKFPADWRNYNNLALIHQNHCQHAWERFLPWHRIYLYEFEQALSEVAGKQLALPYWDWTMPQYKNGDPGGSVIPESFKGFLRPSSIENLEDTTKLTKGDLDGLSAQVVGEKYTSQASFFRAVKAVIGPVKTKKYRIQFIDELLEANSFWYPLRYPANYDGKTINQAIGYHYPTADDVAQIQSINNFRDYGGGTKYDYSFGFLDQNPHNTIHIWSGGYNPEWDPKSKLEGVQVVGRQYHRRTDLYRQPQYGDMFSNLTASYDPIFWPHHINVDRLWSEWQVNHPNDGPQDTTAVLTPWNYTMADTVDIAKFGYEYIKTAYFFTVGIGSPVHRFTSEKVSVPQNALNFKTVEIRLNRVPQLPLSCFVRAFVNQPDANHQTPLEGNDHYAGYLAIFGHGDCYGGPGHCAIPPLQPELYDIRDLNHNTPRNHRIDASECIKKLAQDGGKEFQVTLVVVGADGSEMKDFLRVEAVSLVFKD